MDTVATPGCPAAVMKSSAAITAALGSISTTPSRSDDWDRAPAPARAACSASSKADCWALMATPPSTTRPSNAIMATMSSTTKALTEPVSVPSGPPRRRDMRRIVLDGRSPSRWWYRTVTAIIPPIDRGRSVP